MKRSRTTIRVCYFDSLSETKSGDDSKYLKSKLKIVGPNNNNDIISNDIKAGKRPNSIKATDGINSTSKQWQPKVMLTRLSEKYINKMLRSAGEIPTTSKKPMKSNHIADILPIEFDKDESFIRENSPETANDIFSKRLKIIRDRMIMKERNKIQKSAPQKRKRLLKKPNPELVEFEKTRRRLHKKTEKKEFLNSGRKLYTHKDSFEEYDNEGL